MKPHQPHATEQQPQRKTTEQQQKHQRPHPQPQSRCRQNNPHQHSDRIVDVLWLKLKESAKRREREAGAQARWVLSAKRCAQTSVLLEPEDFAIPDADDFVLEIFTDQMIDFEEARRAEDLRSDWVRQETGRSQGEEDER